MIGYTVALKFMVDLKSEKPAHYFYWFKQVCVHLVFILKILSLKVHFLKNLHFYPRNMSTIQKHKSESF